MDQIFGNWLASAGGLFALLVLVAYGSAALWLALRPSARMAALMPSRWALVMALGGVAIWGLAWSSGGPVSLSAVVGSAARNLGFVVWMAATFALSGGGVRSISSRLMIITLGVINGIAFLFGNIALIDSALSVAAVDSKWLIRGMLMVDMLTASAGLLLVEHVVRHRGRDMRMPVLVVAGGIVAVWAYSLNIHLLSWLVDRAPRALILIEPMVVALVLPAFVLVAMDMGRDRIRLSRTIAVRTIAVMALVAYLVTIALTGALARLVGGDYGDVLQGTLLAIALGLGAVLITSRRSRGWLRVMMSKHFFEHRYDYRAEWMRFTSTLEGRDGEAELPFRRIARALAELTDSPGALLMTADEDGEYRLADHWGWLPEQGSEMVLPTRTTFMLQETGRIVELDALRSGVAASEDSAIGLPGWIIEDDTAWVVLPLLHLGRMAGIAVLKRPIASRPLDWEDLDVLRISSRQAASYIAEIQSQTALSEARRFDEFNRRFAFIMHDVKNLASQLGLLAANAERHADNPEFRADMVETLNLSVTRMNDLLQRLSAKRPASSIASAPVALTPLLAALASSASRRHPVTAACDPDLMVQGDAAAINQILNHLVTNAIDASPDGAPVMIAASVKASMAHIEIIDQGKGMSQDFVRHELFKPFVSTKANGFGLGAFEALQLARGMGGRLEVDSREGEGTCFSLRLPQAVLATHFVRKEDAA